MNPRSAVNRRDSPGRRGVQTQLRLLRHVIAALYLSATAVGIAQGILAPEVPELAVVDGEVVEPREEQLPRILTVLTTYSGRSEFVREYRNAIGDRNEMVRKVMLPWCRQRFRLVSLRNTSVYLGIHHRS